MVLTTSLFKVITVIVKNNLIRIIAHDKTKVTMLVGFLGNGSNTPGPTGGRK